MFWTACARRAGTILAAGALVSSFLGGQALRQGLGLRVASWSGAAVAAFVVSALLTLVILWPIEFRFSVSARAVLDATAAKAVDADLEAGLLRELALQLEARYDENRTKIRWLLWAFELAILFLAIEVAAWIVALWRM